MQYLINGLDGYVHEPKLEKPLGFIRTTTLEKDANQILIHKYNLILCNDKSKHDIDWSKINIKVIAHLVAFERTFVHFLAYLYHASNGYPKVHFQISSKELYALKYQTGHFGLRHYSEQLYKALEWTLGSKNWFKDQTTLLNVHNFLTVILKRNFGEPRPDDEKSEFISPLLLRADGTFEINQLNIYKNMIVSLAGPILKEIPSLVSFYNAYEIFTGPKQISLNIEVVASAKFTGISTFISTFYKTRSLSLYRLFNKEMIESMGCGPHAQDSQTTDSPISFGGSFPNDSLVTFTPPSGPSPSLNDRIVVEDFPDPKPTFTRQASQQAIKNQLNWNDVFGAGTSVKNNTNRTLKDSTNINDNPVPPDNNARAVSSTKIILDADLLCGENSDDYFSDTLEYDASIIKIGTNAGKENEPIFPIPKILTNDSQTESQQGT